MRFTDIKKGRQDGQDRRVEQDFCDPGDRVTTLLPVFGRFCRGRLALVHRLPKQKLDLTVYAAQIIGRPPLEFIPEVGWDPQEEWLSFTSSHPS
jgi:hypothetical protein